MIPRKKNGATDDDVGYNKICLDVLHIMYLITACEVNSKIYFPKGQTVDWDE